MNLSEMAYWSTERMYAVSGDKRTPLHRLIQDCWLEYWALQAAFARE